MRRSAPALIIAAAAVLALTAVAIAQRVSAPGTQGAQPSDAWTCPTSHPIKGNFTTYSGEPCISHVPGGQFYGRTKPEQCYATEDAARQDGCRKPKR